MGFYCVPQTLGLVRNEPEGKSKAKANGKSILEEMGEERYSSSTTLDRSRSKLNEYEGYTKGGECWNAIVEEADAYRSTYTDKNGKERSRRIPQKSVVAVATIIHPPEFVTADWDRDTWEKFDRDTEEVLHEIEPRIYSKTNNRMKAKHRDEGGEHGHRVDVTRDADGRFCGNIYDMNFRQRLAKEFAERMQGRGWDIDDPTLTDWDRYNAIVEAEPDDPEAFRLKHAKREKTDDAGNVIQRAFKRGACVKYANPEYRAEVEERRKKQGLSQPEYSAQQQAETAEKMAQMSEQLADAAETLKAAQGERDDAIAERDKAKEERDKWEHARELVAGKSFKRNGVTMLGRAGEEERRAKLQAENDGLEAELKGKRKAAKDEIDQMKEIAKREIEAERKRVLAKAAEQSEADRQVLHREIAGYAEARRAYQAATPEVTVVDVPLSDAIPVIFEEAEKMAEPMEKRSMITNEVQGHEYVREGQREAHTGIRAALRYLRAWVSVGGRNAFQVLADKVAARFAPKQYEIPQSVNTFTEEHDARHGLSWDDGDGLPY